MSPQKTLILDNDLYKIQRRPGCVEVIINDNYHGIQIVDPWREEILKTFAFAPRYQQGGIISTWCLRSDGNAILVLNEEDSIACWLSLEDEGPNYDCENYPDWSTTNNLRYVWVEDSLWMMGGTSPNIFSLEKGDNGFVFVKRTSLESRRAHPKWARAKDQLLVRTCTVKRVEMDTCQMLYHCFNENPAQIGIMNWNDETDRFVLASTQVARLAASEKCLFVMYEYRVDCYDRQGQKGKTYYAEDGFRYTDLDTLPAVGAYPEALVLGCKSERDATFSKLLVYQLD